MKNSTTLDNDVEVGNSPIFMFTDNPGMVRYIESLSPEDITDASLKKELKKLGRQLTGGDVGKKLIVAVRTKNIKDINKDFFKHEAKAEIDRVNKLIKDIPYSHQKAILTSVELSNNDTYIKNFLHLEELLGLEHRTVGGDFVTDDENTAAGDVKFYRKGASICLGGSVDADTIMEQGDGLVLLLHPRKDKNHITHIFYLNIWKSISGSEEEMRNLVDSYKTWKLDKNRDKNVKFDSDHFYIALHEDNDDRFYIRSNAVRHCATKIFINDKYVERSRTTILTEQFLIGKDAPKNSKKRTERGFVTLKHLINHIIDGVLVLPDYQRETIPNEKLVDQYVGDTIMNDLQYIRGEFMFHHVDDKIYLVDGQQRIFNAVYNYFVKDEGKTYFSNDYKTLVNGRDLSHFSWSDFNELAKDNEDIKKFRDDLLNRKFSVKHYFGYTQTEMAQEYIVANRNTTMNRQELRAASNSALGKYIRYFTATLWKSDDESSRRDSTFESLRKTKLKIKLFDDFFKRKRKVLDRLNITTARMNIDEIVSNVFNCTTNWGKKSFKEDDNSLDKLYDQYRTDEQVLKDWPKVTEYFDLITTALEFFKNNPVSFPNNYKKKDRRLRNKLSATDISNKEEWDIIMYLIVELKRLNTDKKLTITGDVISKILTKHYSMVVFPSGKEEVGKTPEANENETPYGLSTRVDGRSHTVVTTKWFPHWKELLEMKPAELKKFGFSFE